MTTFYLSKYAPTKGIVTVDELVDESDTEIKVGTKTFKIGRDVFTSLNDARKDAVKRTRRKVTALLKKEEKLETLISSWEDEIDGNV